jgi:hypothetical protein
LARCCAAGNIASLAHLHVLLALLPAVAKWHVATEHDGLLLLLLLQLNTCQLHLLLKLG